MLKIGEFCRLAQVSVKTLRYYAQRGLLAPAWVDRYTGYRYYELTQLSQLHRILALKDLGFTLDEIDALIHEEVPASELRGMLRLRRAELERQVHQEQARLGRVESRLRQIERGEHLPEYDVIVRSVARLRALSRSIDAVSRQDVANQAWQLMDRLLDEGLGPQDVSPVIAIYDEQPDSQETLNVQLCVPWHKRAVGQMALSERSLPAVTSMACTVHQGLATLDDAHTALWEWLQANSYLPGASGRELYYWADPSTRSTDSQIIQVIYPVTYKEKTMETKIVTKDTFSVIGLRYYGKNEHGEIPSLWGQLGPRTKELSSDATECVAIGYCADMDPAEDGAFEYVAGYQVNADCPVPEGMVKRDVPAGRYLVLSCTLQGIHDAYDYAFQTWFPTSGHTKRAAADFELYDETFDGDDPASLLYIYIPID